ncbi:hypothetical protein AM588_10010447 [Phytophthora nicotianae]|uniref:Uncharacterized protein n=1 Tax=Phytophthora nicotianae TaxID=4792 RepID=A0A0W8DB23_PHYNI|nr:hypothetical protein AM588_10010447 [Phytophthora nicotianae]
MPGRMSALFKIEINWLRGIYIAVFFCNAIFATMFKTIGQAFFDGYVPFTRVASGFFILFQIFSIVSVSYQVRDTLLNAIENAEKAATEGKLDKGSCAGSVCLWYEYFSPFKNHFLTPTFARRKTAFLGVCAGSLVAVGAAIAYLNGVRKDIMLPKGLPSMTDDIICGVCRSPVDARGLIASRKEAKRLDFEKKESKFVQNGCYINPGGARGYSGYSYNTGSNASTRKPPRPTDGKTSGSLTAAQQALGPPKMDRINVQRTTRWLACVAQIIRLTGAPAMAPISTATSLAANVSATTTPSAVNDATKSTPTVPALPTLAKSDTNGVIKTEPEAEKAPTPTSTRSSKIKDSSLVTPAMQALFDEAMRLVRPYDSYALSKLETAHDMLLHRSGPGVAVLRMLTHEYTRFVYIKHTRAVEKARNEKRKRAEHEAHEHREKERKRMSLEAERALKKQMLAMRNKQRQHLKATSSK